MAVNIDTVYQRILALANKEQRGYITPQEFNLFANHAQMEIFEQYFYDLNQFSRIPGNDTTYADMVSILEEKIQLFQEYMDPTTSVQLLDTADSTDTTYLLDSSPLNEMYRLDQLYLDNKRVEIVNNKDFNRFARFNGSSNLETPLYKPSINRPIATISNSSSTPGNMQIALSHSGDLAISWIRIPTRVRWGYTILGTDAFYDATTSNNFELHESEQTELVYRILAQAGISIQKPEITQIAAGLEGAKLQQEKK